jgi:hypothetical protein
MKEVKMNSQPEVLKPNVKSISCVVETNILEDGSVFFIIRNPQGAPWKICKTSEELAQFFDGFKVSVEDESKD